MVKLVVYNRIFRKNVKEHASNMNRGNNVIINLLKSIYAHTHGSIYMY